MRARSFLPGFLTLQLAACAHHQGPEPEVITTRIAQPCRGLGERRLASVPTAQGAVPRVVIEIASVLTEDLPEPVGPYLRGHPVRIGGAATLLVENDATEVAPWATCPTSDCQVPNVWAFAVTPHLLGGSLIQISVLLKPASGLAEESQVTVIETPDQGAVVLPFSAVDNGRPTTLVLTPYRIDDDADLQTLLACRQTPAP